MLTLSSVSVRFGGVQALDNLSLEIPDGQVTGLIGPNGAGKTTVFNVLTAFLQPNSGSVTFHGQEISRYSPAHVARLGIVRTFQELRLFPALTALENVMLAVPTRYTQDLFVSFLRGAKQFKAIREEAIAALKYVGLDAHFNKRATQLGYGEQKLLSLARILATGGKYLLLDEPSSGLDAHQIERMLALIENLISSGKTVCIVEHNIDTVARASDRIIVLHQGKEVAAGTPAEVLRDRTVLRVYLGE